MLPGGKGQYGYVRLIEEKGKKVRKTPKQEGPVPLDLHNASGSTSSVRNSAPTPGNSIQLVPVATGSAQPQSAPLEELQEASEWAIRIGDAPPPVWGKKRSLTQEDTPEDGPKRKRVDSGYVFWSLVYLSWPSCRVLPPLLVPCTTRSRYLSRPSIEDDSCVREVAAVYRFTPAEVGEYYLRVNRNKGRTTRRFDKARKLLDAMSDVE